MVVTIQKIAELSGVSRGTVDRVLHGRPNVNPMIREKVVRAAEKLGYQPPVPPKSADYRQAAILIPQWTDGHFNRQIVSGIRKALRYIADPAFVLTEQPLRTMTMQELLRAMNEQIRSGVDGLIIRAENTPEVRAAIEQGKLTYEDYSQDVLMLQLHAASLGLPFLPVRLMQGSGLVKYWGISEEQRKTLDKVDDLKYVEMDNPFNPGEKIVAVPVPKLDTAIIHVQKASPDGTCIIEGDEFHDVDIAVAARKVIVTCDELVSDEYIRRDPTLTKVFGECVNAVVHCPYGAWPSQCYNYYDNDSHALKEYDKASKYQDAEDAKAQLAKAAAKAEKAAAAKPEDEKLAEAAARAKKAADDAAAGVAVPETFKDYLDKWVYSVKDHDELLDKIGGARLMRLKNEPHLGYSTRH